MRVPLDRVDEFASVINRNPGSRNNYLRDHDYNLWFTLAALKALPFARTVDGIVARPESPADLLTHLVRRFKIGVRFRFFPDGDGGAAHEQS